MKLYCINASARRVLGFWFGLAAILAVGAACNQQAGGPTGTQAGLAPSMLLTKSNGREIRASVANVRGSGIQSLRDSGAIVTFDGRKIRVERDRLLLNGKQAAVFSAEAKLVEIVYADSIVTVTIDGEKIVERSL
jgi:hypothetical protein